MNSIIALLSPIHFFHFFLLRITCIINRYKTNIFSFKREIIIIPKITKMSRNELKIDIKGISRRLEICKNIISA